MESLFLFYLYGNSVTIIFQGKKKKEAIFSKHGGSISMEVLMRMNAAASFYTTLNDKDFASEIKTLNDDALKFLMSHLMFLQNLNRYWEMNLKCAR